MKKLFVAFVLFAFGLMAAPSSYATSNFYGAITLTGGTTGALDAINGTSLADNDAAYVVTTTDYYVYVLDDDSAAAESSPDVIAPDSNAGDKRWILIFHGDAATAELADLAVTDSNFIVGNGTTWVAESGATARTSIGLGTADDVDFNTVDSVGQVDAGTLTVNSGSITDTSGAISFGNENLTTTGTLAGATLNTGQGAYELYAMNQDVETTDAVTFATVDTGQGANELYDMDQNVLTTSSPTFGGLVVTGGQSVKKTNISDANYGTSALTSDYIVAFTSLTAARTATISTEDEDSGTATQPRVMIFKDESGSAATYNITISLESGGTIDGAANFVIDQPYQSVTIYLNGTNGFIY